MQGFTTQEFKYARKYTQNAHNIKKYIYQIFMFRSFGCVHENINLYKACNLLIIIHSALFLELELYCIMCLSYFRIKHLYDFPSQSREQQLIMRTTALLFSVTSFPASTFNLIFV